MKKFQRIICVAVAGLSALSGMADKVVWYDGNAPVSVALDTKTDLVVGTAVEMFASDMEAVTGRKAASVRPAKAGIIVSQIDKAGKSQRKRLEHKGIPVARLDTLTDGFNITVAEGKIYVTGSNGRGAAYGLLELSRKAGVSPWVWWGDVVPEKREILELPDDFSLTKGASVEFRGIFINDEDWSLRPWSQYTFEPNKKGTIGPRTYKEIFKLLMRLRANAIWPGMHPGTEAFFKNPNNKLVADSCGIAVGTSHCEPLLRNNVDEWSVKDRGAFNYITNRDEVQKYWIERLEEVKNSTGGNMFTIGMRGIHDGSMEGVKTEEEKFNALQQVISDQQELLAKHVGDPSEQMQVFVPYKEVLELYEKGLDVPDYVTLMWCDDNFGYITRLSNEEEQKRIGGGGVYYHLSYWGRPHDHLWLTTTPPGLIYNEMLNAYNHNVRKLWIANVHDPKVAAYDLNLFLDLAWDIESVENGNVGLHLKNWLCETFGQEAGEKTYPAMRTFYNLAAKRRPEFMGWNQVELDKKYYNRGISPVTDTEFSFTEFGGEADRYMEEYAEAARIVEEVENSLPEGMKDAYFAAVTYPVVAAANHAVKMIEAQRARSFANGGSKVKYEKDNPAIFMASAKSQKAYQKIRELTERYNEKMSGGKWRGLMNMRPRDLPFGFAPTLPLLLTDAEADVRLAGIAPGNGHPLDAGNVVARNAASYSGADGDVRIIDLLGHSGRSVELGKGSSVSYTFSLPEDIENPEIKVALIPTQPNDGGNVRFSVSIDGGAPVEFDIKEAFRSEGWKKNVMRGQALRTFSPGKLAAGDHQLTVKAIDSHIVIDQWSVDPKKGRRHYLIPAE